MDGLEFEDYCAGLLRSNGYENVRVTRGSGDQGVDIVAERDGVKYGIQCKCLSSDVGNGAVQEALAGKAFYGYHVAVVLTNRSFTRSAIELARHSGVVLWDRNKLTELVRAAGLDVPTEQQSRGEEPELSPEPSEAVRSIRSLYDSLKRMCTTLDEKGVPESMGIEGITLADMFEMEIIRYTMWLSGSDGRVTDEEARVISELVGRNLDAQFIEELIEDSDLSRIGTRMPLSASILGDVCGGNDMDACEILMPLYRGIGMLVVLADGEADEGEKRKLVNFLDMLESGLESL